MAAHAPRKRSASERFAPSVERFDGIIEHADTPEADQMSESEFERDLEVRIRELKRQILQDRQDRLSGLRAVGPVKDSEGRERTIVREHERTLRTTFGEIEVKRLGYGAEGTESLHPLDARQNLPADGYSLELRRRIAREAARGSFEEAVEAVHETTGVLVPKRQAEQLAARAAEDFEDFYDLKRGVDSLTPAEEPVLAMSLDGKGIVMRHEDLRPETRKKADQREPHLTPRLGPGEKAHAKRMAVVAAVYTIGRHERAAEDVFAPRPRPAPAAPPPRPANKRVWASLEQDVETVVNEMFLEADSRDPEHKREWVVVADGNEQQLRLVKQAAERAKISLTVIVDVIHVLEYVWAAGLALHEGGQREELERWVLEHMRQILKGRVSLVAAGMRRSATLRDLSNERRRPVDKAADYLLAYKRFLRYDLYLVKGYPIASGVIEGACRHLVNIRMNRSGARWSLNGAEAVLRLRALLKCGDFDAYWTFHEQRELERNHLLAYADRKLPELEKPAVSRFRLVK